MKAKYLIILSVLLVIGLSTYSQVLIKEGKIWSYAKSPSEDPNRTYTSHYKFGEEVNVNDTIYNTVYVSSTYEPYDWVKTNVFGLYREQDSIIYNRRTMYFGGVEQDIEYLYFDFTKKTGDSIFIDRFSFPIYVDSIVNKNIQGLDLKHWYLTGYWEHFVFIEKIGTHNGFMTPGMLIGAYITLLCVSEDDQVFYMDPEYNSCHVVKNSIEQLILPECPFVITANSDQQLLVYNETGTAGTLSFYTANGQKLGVFEITEAHTNMHLPHKGLIMYRFVSTEGYEKVGKLVVQ